MYSSKLSVKETERAIKWIKDSFETLFKKTLNLERVSAPLFVKKESGINDMLTGKERPLSFAYQDDELEVVQSLAKWKRDALARYGFKKGEGLYTDMDAIRPDETLSYLHSLYVDQWVWEYILPESQRRDTEFLQSIVHSIYEVLKSLDRKVASQYNALYTKLPEVLHWVHAETLKEAYPSFTPKEREEIIAKKWRAVFIQGIGKESSHGRIHEARSPDYDDWRLNGDIIVWHEPLGKALELTSMGIRVDAERLRTQLEIDGSIARQKMPFHQKLLQGGYPDTIGGGIGQSRLCLFLLEKMHIGEVQASYWPEAMRKACEKHNIPLL